MVNTHFPSVKERRPTLATRSELTARRPRDNLALITIRSPNSRPRSMTRVQARETAREILEIIPLVMRTVAAELRAAGEMPAPAHFGLLSILSVRPRMLTELASLQGVSLPTMSNSISAMVERGWVRRAAPDGDRRVVMIEVTPTGRAALERVGRARRGAPGRRARAARSAGAAAAAGRPRRAAQGVCRRAGGRRRARVTEHRRSDSRIYP